MDDACKRRPLIITGSENVIKKLSEKHQKQQQNSYTLAQNLVFTEKAKILIFMGKHESSQRFFRKKRHS